MGNTCAWPVLRTTDLTEALTLAEKLLSLTPWHDPSGCFLQAWARDEAELRRLTEVLPGARVGLGDRRHGQFPEPVSLGVTDYAQASEALRTWAEITRCYVVWHNLKCRLE